MGRYTLTLLAALLAGGATWAEEIKYLDARTHHGDEGARYYLVFCARNSGAWISLPGHAFVIWIVEDAQHHSWIEKAYGFHPGLKSLKGVFCVVLGCTVRGKVVDEHHDPDARRRLQYLTHRLIVQVNHQQFDQTQTCVDCWQSHEYCLFCKNCKSFLWDVANQAGLEVPCSRALERPGAYLRRLSEQATVRIAHPAEPITMPLPADLPLSRFLAEPPTEP